MDARKTGVTLERLVSNKFHGIKRDLETHFLDKAPCPMAQENLVIITCYYPSKKNNPHQEAAHEKRTGNEDRTESAEIVCR